jgi:hypothetical protein
LFSGGVFRAFEFSLRPTDPLITPVTIVMMMMIVIMVLMVMMMIVIMVLMVMMIVMMIIVAIAATMGFAGLIALVLAPFGFGQDQLCRVTKSWCHYFSTIPDERKRGQHMNDRAC